MEQKHILGPNDHNLILLPHTLIPHHHTLIVLPHALIPHLHTLIPRHHNLIPRNQDRIMLRRDQTTWQRESEGRLLRSKSS